MYGDLAPLKALSWLLTRHEQLQLYIDDAHGMSWCGRRGRGFAAEQLSSHERVTIAVSLNKAFGAAGGALVFPNAKLRLKVRSCGGPMIFTGPVQPPMLGAALASARIHLSPEIEELQQDLLERIRYANRLAAELDLPLVSRSEVPIRYVGLGLLAACYDMTSHLLERGVFVNPAAFPAVGTKYSGIRFNLTRHQSLEDIRKLLETVAERLPFSLASAGTSREEIDRTFNLEPAERPRRTVRRALRSATGPQLSCRHEDSIRALDAREWDACLGGRGSFDSASLALLEDVFGPKQAPENRWKFHYYVVRDGSGRPLLATFFTEALWKDDLLAAARVSQAVEQQRERDRFFLTSRSLAMGSLLTEGEHLYLDRSRDWRAALDLVLDAVGQERAECESPTLVLRDMRTDDVELGEYLKGAGFLQLSLPPSMEIEIDWSSREEFLAARTRRERRFHREQVIPRENAYEVEVLRKGGRRPSQREWRHLNALYRNVQGRNLALNTFPLPENLLPRLIDCRGWEILLLRLRPEHGGQRDALPQGLMAAYAGREHYVPVVTGMDYALVESHGLYRQLLSQTVRRAEALGVRRIHFGMGAELEKIRFGARPAERVMYVQSHDHFHHDVLTLIASDPGLQRRR